MLLPDLIDEQCKKSYEANKARGFWDFESDTLDTNQAIIKLMLIHSEVSEALEALRTGNLRDKHLPQYGNFEVELADILERTFDLAGRFNISLGTIWKDKIEFNETRGFRHGNKKF